MRSVDARLTRLERRRPETVRAPVVTTPAGEPLGPVHVLATGEEMSLPAFKRRYAGRPMLWRVYVREG